MDTRKMFVHGLAVDEDDEQLRLAFADWLDEQGENEEAERQRNWKAAKEWIFRLCEEHPDRPYDDQPTTAELTYTSLMTRAADAVNCQYSYIQCYSNESLARELNNSTGEFWRNWSIVTGIPIPHEKLRSETYFGCAC
jgi:uncharacterized protein (TIGR02996 family)